MKRRLRRAIRGIETDLPKYRELFEKERVNSKAWREYFATYNFYKGKLFAYLWMLGELGDKNFVQRFFYRHNFQWHNKKRGEMKTDL